MDIENRLIAEAIAAQKNSYSPYSKFAVGCALVDDKGQIFTGCNMEIANFSEGICAERVAIAKMVSSGGRKICKIAVVTPSNEVKFPCGACRQTIQEFGESAEVIAVNQKATEVQRMNQKDLFPGGFGPKDLGL